MPGILAQTYLLNRGYGVHATSWQEGKFIRLQLPKNHDTTGQKTGENIISFYLTNRNIYFQIKIYYTKYIIFYIK